MAEYQKQGWASQQRDNELGLRGKATKFENLCDTQQSNKYWAQKHRDQRQVTTLSHCRGKVVRSAQLRVIII